MFDGKAGERKIAVWFVGDHANAPSNDVDVTKDIQVHVIMIGEQDKLQALINDRAGVLASWVVFCHRHRGTFQLLVSSKNSDTGQFAVDAYALRRELLRTCQPVLEN